MKKLVVVLLHCGYWFVYLLLLSVLLLMIQQGERVTHNFVHPAFILFMGILSIVPSLVSFYSSYTFLFSKFLSRRRIFALFFRGLLVVIIASLSGGIGLSLAFGPKFMFVSGWDSALGESLMMAIIALIHGVLGLVMRGFVTSYGDIQLKEDLHRKNTEMELALLKSQINPHFLFNTINNIDVLIAKDAVRASAYLNKLSDIMRFMLYETKPERIPLAHELHYIEKYIDLQKIRTSNPDYIRYEVKGDVGGLSIAPMLFIPFIENAFKHAEPAKSGNAITINFVIEPAQILFICTNRYNAHASEKPDYGGLGNHLIQKRLELLYPGKHSLETVQANEKYTVKLVLQHEH